MADDDSIESSNVTVEPRQESQYSARVIIVVNRTGRKGDSCKDYDRLPTSVLTVASDLREFFESLNMLVYYKENVDQTAIREIVSKVVRERPSYGDDEKIMFYYIGHGEMGELVPYCTCINCRFEAGIEDGVRDSDGKPQKIVDLIEMFHNKRTIDLRKLPVLFFFDCCQGKDRNEGFKVKSKPLGSLPPEVQYGHIVRYIDRIPDAGNILIAHSTLPMLKAYCHPKHGPHWSRILLENLKIDQSISDALHATQREVSTIDNSITDLKGNIILHGTQPSMFYSSLYCEPINFGLMRANSRIIINATTRDPDSGYPEESESEAMDGDDTGSENKPSQTAASQESESDPSKSMMYPGSNNPVQQLEALEKDVEDKTREVSELKQCITQLKQEAEKREEEYAAELANKEKEMNDLRRELELKEKELEDTKTKAQDSERQNQIVNEELKKKLEKAKKEHEDTISKLSSLKDKKALEIALLELEHAKTTNRLEIKIREQETELERKNKEIAQEQLTIASLKVEISEMKTGNAIKERDVAIKRADKYKRKFDEVEREREEARGAGNQDQTNKAQKQRPSSSSITQGMENMNLNTEAIESDDNPSTG